MCEPAWHMGGKRASDAEAMVTGNAVSALIIPLAWNKAHISYAPESEEQLLSPGQLKGGGYFCFASHYPLTHTFRKCCDAWDMD